jgi:hypothetical protein
MDKIKSLFSGGSSTDARERGDAGHDHAGPDHSHEPASMPADPAGMPTSDSDEDRPA